MENILHIAVLSNADGRKKKYAKRVHSVEGLDHGVLVDGVDGGRTHTLAELEDRLDDGELSGSGVETCWK